MARRARAAIAIAAAGCGEPSADEVQQQRAELAARPGVKSVDVAHEPGSFPLPGSVGYEVTMDAPASDREVVDLVARTYDAFDSSLRGIEAHLGVYARGGEILLHTDHPRADSDEVEAAVEYALDARRRGESIALDMYAGIDDVDGDFKATLVLGLGSRATASDVLPRIRALERRGSLPRHVGIGVRAPDEAALATSESLPTDSEQAVWEELSGVGPRRGFSVDYGPTQVYDDFDDFATAVISLRPARMGGRDLTRSQHDAMAHAHLRILHREGAKFLYIVNKGVGQLAYLHSRRCDVSLTRDHSFAADLQRWYRAEAHLAPCTGSE